VFKSKPAAPVQEGEEVCERHEYLIAFRVMEPSPSNAWVVALPEEQFKDIMVRRSIFEFSQAALPADASVLVVPEGTEAYPLSVAQIKVMHENMPAMAGTPRATKVVVDISRETEAPCPMCGQGTIRVVHDVHETDGS